MTRQEKRMIKMFFFFNLIHHDIIKYCLHRYIQTNIEYKSYCDISELFADTNKQVVKNSVSPYSYQIDKLYKEKYPENIDDLKCLNYIYLDSYPNRIIEYSEMFAILFWCFKIFKRQNSFDKNKEIIMEELMTFIHDDLELVDYIHFDSIIYDKRNATINVIDSISKFLTALKSCSPKEELFFRGHSKTTYKLIPSILRADSLKEKEHLIYQELIINCPDEFKGFHRHIDYLVKMQHYGLPTRLLDITRNPLVALYFACCNNLNSIGEVIPFSADTKRIKYANSDTVAMLSSLPVFSYEDKIELMDALYMGKKATIIERFEHEIQTEKPGFKANIDVSDLDGCFIVQPHKDNNRIMKQDGAFIICGVNDLIQKKINDSLRLYKNNKAILFFVLNKAEILSELDLLSINKSSLFPEIDHVSEYIKSKYGKC